MRTINKAVSNNRKLKQTPILIALLIALALVASFQTRSAATAESTTTESTIVLDTNAAPFIDGTVQTVKNGAGNQSDPHLSCNRVSYTDDSFQGIARVHYQDLSTGTDNAIPSNEADLLSAISGSRVAYTKVTASGDTIRIFDANSQTTTVVPGTRRSNPSIGGNLVAFEDTSTLTPEISTYDLSTGIVTPLTSDSLYDRNPRVSPNGNAVVWEKCQLSGLGCDIYAAVQSSPGVFTTRALTTGGGEDLLPSTDGEVVVYTSNRTGENDVYYQPLNGSSEVHLSILGDQRHATVSRHLISFESRYLTSYDIYVYDIRAGNLSRATNTLHDERLSEISVCRGVGRIVSVIPEDGTFDTYAFSFAAPRVTEDDINDLISLIGSFNLSQGTANSLISKLQNALDAIEASDTATACSSLSAFINVCTAQSGKKLPTDQATQLINSANEIKSDLGCQ